MVRFDFRWTVALRHPNRIAIVLRSALPTIEQSFAPWNWNAEVMPRGSTPQPVVIESQEQLDDLCAQCQHVGRFGYDTEFVMEDRFESEVCLIQIATESRVGIVDPFLELDIQALWELICDEDVETIVHAGQEDLNLCARHTGRPPRRVFDLQIAAGLVGLDYPISLQRLVQSVENIRLHKSKTLTDWRRRPLTSAQVYYAAEDVAHLLALHERLASKLRNLKRTKWAAEEFAALENAAMNEPTKTERIIRLKGSASLNGRQLATLAEVLDWREKWARRLNRPARILLKDHLIVEIAKHAINSVRGLRELRGVNLNGTQVRELCDAVEKSLKVPERDLPERQVRDVETPWETTLIAMSTAIARSFCLENHLAYSLAATQKSIREVVRHCDAPRKSERSRIKLLNGWRGKTIGKVLEQVLSGTLVVHVDASADGGGRIRMVPVEKAV